MIKEYYKYQYLHKFEEWDKMHYSEKTQNAKLVYKSEKLE